jgi:hypothetical protein
MPERDYLAALKVADNYVTKKKNFSQNPSAISSSMIKTLFGRYYEVGDNWDIAAWPSLNNTMRMTSETNSLKNRVGKGGIFHYEVSNVKTGMNPEVTIKVTQSENYGFPIIDPQVKTLTLKMTDQMIQSKKTYFMEGRNEGYDVSPVGLHTLHELPNGSHSLTSLLEMYPLDVPEVSTAERRQIQTLPSLPDTVEKFASQTGFKPELSRCSWLDQDDFFGRPVQILWQHGDPWPAYFKTQNGIAILIRKGGR